MRDQIVINFIPMGPVGWERSGGSPAASPTGWNRLTLQRNRLGVSRKLRRLHLSGAAKQLNEGRSRALFRRLERRLPGDRDSLAERGGFEPPEPQGLT